MNEPKQDDDSSFSSSLDDFTGSNALSEEEERDEIKEIEKVSHGVT